MSREKKGKKYDNQAEKIHTHTEIQRKEEDKKREFIFCCCVLYIA